MAHFCMGVGNALRFQLLAQSKLGARYQKAQI